MTGQLLITCGGGPCLVIGADADKAAHELVLRGVNAAPSNLDALTQPSSPGVPSNLEASCDTLASLFALDDLDNSQVAAGFRAFRRTARRAVFVLVTIKPASARDRTWWEEQALAAGFRRHPLYQRAAHFASLEADHGVATIVLEPLREQADAMFPREWLLPRRELHMDMLREAGRRSDAHVARYALACDYIRTNDVVLDAACGMGYGAAVLACGSDARRVLGVDASPDAIAYAQAHYGGAGIGTEFHAADVTSLSFLPDASVDVVVSFETLEHVADPLKLLREFNRVLTPGGRVLVSVPNNWADESGKDPNPNHLHVYTWESLAAQLQSQFIIERRWRQVAGGGRTLTDRARVIQEVAPDTRAPDEPEAEWWLAAAMKTPLGADKRGYEEKLFPSYVDLEGFHLSAFVRDYDNPWLFRSLICIGPRITNEREREKLARQVIESARAGSADQGAAICVLAYHVLSEPTPQRIAQVLDLIERFETDADGTPHAWRWRISNRYVAARLRLAQHDRAAARTEFLRCAAMDPVPFSPLLATKTVDAWLRAAIISVADGDAPAARSALESGLLECRRIVSGSWTNIWGRPDRPQPYGLSEVAQVMDVGSACSAWLSALDRFERQPGQAWMLAKRQSFAELVSWTQVLQRDRSWLEQQRGNWQRIAHERDLELRRLRAAADSFARAQGTDSPAPADLEKLLEAAPWHQHQAQRWESIAKDHADELEKARTWAQELSTALAWMKSQHAALQAARDTAQQELQRTLLWARELKTGLDWQQLQRETQERLANERAAELERCTAWAHELQQGLEWHQAQRSAQLQASAAADAELEKCRRWIQELQDSLAWHKTQVSNWEQIAQERTSELSQTRQWNQQLDEGLKFAHDQRRALERTLSLADQRLNDLARKADESAAAQAQTEQERNTILAEKSLLQTELARVSAELARMRSLPLHRVVVERWKNPRNSGRPTESDANAASGQSK